MHTFPFPMRATSAAVLMLSLGAVAPYAAAQQANTADPAASAQLQELVVSASRSQAKVEDMPLHTTIVTQQDIQNSPAQTLDQLLRNVPGLNFTGVPETQSDPTGQSTKMRGLGTAKVLVLLDGVPVMDPFYLTTQWFKLPLSSIDHVEVVRGGNSSLWGNMAVAGVINIVSKRVKDDAGEFAISAGSHGSSNLSLTKNFKVNDVLGLRFTADQLDSKGYQLTPAAYTWRYPAKGPINAKDSNLGLTAYLTPSDDVKAYVRVGAHIQDQSISYQFGQNLQQSPDISASLGKRLADKSNITATAWAQYVDFNKFNGATCYWQASSSTKCPSAASVTPAQVNNQIVQYYTQNSTQGYHEAGSSLMYSKDIGQVWRDLQVGVDYRRLSAADQEYFYSAPTSLAQLQNFNSSTYGTAVQTFGGLFAQTKIVPIKPLEITLSARYDGYWNTNRFNTRTAGGVTTGGAQPDTSKTALDPSLAFRYTFNDDFAMRGAMYKSFRAPGFNNTLRTYGSPNPTIANPNLNPETLLGRELGADFNHGPFAFGATWFLYDIQNMIATSNYQYVGAGNVNNSPNIPALVQTICGGPALAGCGGKASYYSNGQNGQSQGIELTAHWNAKENVRLDASFTRTNTVLTSNQVSTAPLGVQLAGTPWNMANASITWAPTSKLHLYAQAHYIGKMYIDTTSTIGTYYSQGGNVIYDVSGSYAVNKSVDVTAQVVNLFNKTYTESAYTYNQPWTQSLSAPLTFNLGVRVRF